MAKKILIVDDESQLLVMLKNRFIKAGFDVMVAEDGQDGYELAKKEKPDLIILDIMLPKLDGYRICGLLKNDARFTKTPIILFSAKAQTKDAELAKEAGADAYLTKLTDSKVLVERVKQLIGKT